MTLSDVIIVGAGAAGLMCAIEAGKRGRKVLVLDGNQNVGEKIRISGGGRCNFTNLHISKDNFISNNPEFCISALQRFGSEDFIALMNKHQISYHQKTLGQLFCDHSAKQIIDMLLFECQENNVKIILQVKVQNVEKVTEQFLVKTNQGQFFCQALVVASGGLSIPKMGASDFGYKIAQNFGLKIINPSPALVPFTLGEKILEKTQFLAGVALPVLVSCGKRKFSESLLFTHKGLSGPAILQISTYWKKEQTITINFAPKLDVFAWLKEIKNSQINKIENNAINLSKQEISNLLANILPKKLALFITKELQVVGTVAEISNKKLQQIAQQVNCWNVMPCGTEGFAKAEVTLGGICTSEISSKTFQSYKINNLYFIGEVLDVTGHLGGYNFAWAWASGFVAGQFV